MKEKCIALLLLLVIMGGLTACSNRNDTVGSENRSSDVRLEITDEESNPSFRELDEMREITVEGNRVTVVLLQDRPLPYRWVMKSRSDCATLIEEYEVEDSANGSLFSDGSALEYHVFVFELAESSRAELEFYNCWVVEPENLDEANGKRKYTLEFADGDWFVQNAE